MRKVMLWVGCVTVALVVASCNNAGGGGGGGGGGGDPRVRNDVTIADLWAHYPFDSDGGSISFADASGNGRDASVAAGIQNTPGSTADRIGDGSSFALELDGDNDEGLEVASDTTLQNASTISVSFWMTDNAGNGRIIGQRYGAGTSTWEIDVSNTFGWKLRYSYSGSTKLEATADAFSAGWNHVVLVLQETSTYARLYVNGTLQGTDDFTDPTELETENPLRIGETGFDGAEVQLDDVRIYTRALTASEVTTLYNE
ncbi:MAG: hypothetical protein GVY29_12860 [Spirochaetes bacterium]|nr:hypothetical protein [Spirochaetota bacterium]